MPWIDARHAFQSLERRIRAPKVLQPGEKRRPPPQQKIRDATPPACRPPEFKTYVCFPLADHMVVQRRVKGIHPAREGGH